MEELVAQAGTRCGGFAQLEGRDMAVSRSCRGTTILRMCRAWWGSRVDAGRARGECNAVTRRHGRWREGEVVGRCR